MSEKKDKHDICPAYSEIPYINTNNVEGYTNCLVSSMQGRCADTKKDCCCIGDKKMCEKKKKNSGDI